MKRALFYFCTFIIMISLSGCGFHLRGEMKLAPALHRMYLQTSDPYSHLSRSLKQYLMVSKVTLVATPDEANTILVILSDNATQDFVSVGGTQQTRQYNLTVTVQFEMTDKAGRVLLPVQSLSESHALTIQANQVLGSSNEVNLFFTQMRSTLAYAIINRIASKEVSKTITTNYLLNARIESP